MKYGDLFDMLLFALYLAPAFSGIVDGGCWFVAGHGCSPIDWLADGGARIGFAVAWTVLVPMISLVLFTP